MAAVTRKNKYNARKTECPHGHIHSSGREAARCAELHLLQRAGEISGLRVQPQFWFVINGKQATHTNGRRLGFKPDFHYFTLPDLRDVVEDSKGVRTEAYVLRAALFRALFPDVELREV